MIEQPEAAHAASEYDDYAGALPEAGGIVLIVVAAVVLALAAAVWAVLA